jgi:hypothetical protein
MATNPYWGDTSSTASTTTSYWVTDYGGNTAATSSTTTWSGTSDWVITEGGDHIQLGSGDRYTVDSLGYITINYDYTIDDVTIKPYKEPFIDQTRRVIREALAKEARDIKERERNKAEHKAVKLLEHLIGDEVEVYKKTGRVFVKSEDGNEYIVRKNQSVQKIEKNKVIDLCVKLDYRFKCPSTDNVIALKMLLENDEKHVLKLANRIGTQTRPKELPLAACM